LGDGHQHGDGQAHYETDYDLGDIFPGPYLPDVEFCFQRMAEETRRAAWRERPGRLLDVGCGTAKDLVPFLEAGWEVWGAEPSLAMLGLADSDLGALRPRLNAVRAFAEFLPFPDRYFDRVVTKGAVDHFVDTGEFAREAARVLKTDGRLVVTMSNFRSLSFRIGKAAYPLHKRLRPALASGRPYWQPHDDHTFVGDYEQAVALGRESLDLERAYGVSMLWMLPGWGRLLGYMPGKARGAALKGLDQAARRAPRLADCVVTVWRQKAAGSER
jgi:SAM-dependent methyltransferase